MARNSQYVQKETYIPSAAILPDDYVGEAENVMTKLKYLINTKNRNTKITTSKIRSILSMVSEIYNFETYNFETRCKQIDNKLHEKSLMNLQLLRIRLVYESGRNPYDIGVFIEKSHLIDYLLDVKDNRQKFFNYAHYVEALVAYHRFFGGSNY